MASLTHRAEFYYNLALLLEAGLPTARACDHRFAGPFRNAGPRLKQRILNGATLSEAMQADPLFSPYELALTRVGENSGHLPEIFRSLEAWYRQSALLKSKIISGFLYPAFLYVAANLIVSIVDLLTSQLSMAAIIAGLCLRLALPAILLPIAIPLLRTALNTTAAGIFLARVPFFGKLAYNLESSRFFRTFGLCLQAGLEITKAADLSADCCRNGAYRRRYRSIGPAIIRQHMNFGEAFRQKESAHDRNCAVIPLIDSGETSGQLDQAALRIAGFQYAEAVRALEAISKIAPVIVYLAVAAFVVSKIFQLMAGYVTMINDLTS